MIITLANGKEVILAEVTKDPKVEGLQWLREYKEGKDAMKPQVEQMTVEQCYAELDRLAEYRRIHGRGRNPDAYQARYYCKETRAKVKARLKQLKAPLTRPGDGRVYGPGGAPWQRAGGAL